MASELSPENETEFEQFHISPDRNPTTRNELYGWYSYAWASEPFGATAISTFIPLLLERFARQVGVYGEDHSTPCTSSISHAPNSTLALRDVPDQSCVINVAGGVYINTSSFALYTFSFSVLIQTLSVISVSGAADRGHSRKRLFLWFALVGSIATSLFIFATPKHYLIASLLTVISNSSYGAMSVCANSFLPVLVNNHPETLAAFAEIEAEPLLNDSEQPPHTALMSVTSRVSQELSGKGAACGYISTLLLQLILMGVIILTGSTIFSIQIAIFLIGIWWLLFLIPVAIYMKSRPGRPLLVRQKQVGTSHRVSSFLNAVTQGGYGYVVYGWQTLFETIHEARKMRDITLFLLGWFLISDALTTISSSAILFAQSELKMSASSLSIINLLVMLFAIMGATATPKFIVPRFKTRNPIVGMLFVLVLASAVPLYGIIGFFQTTFGLRHPWEMYVVACWYGFTLGGYSTLSRSIFSLLIPRGKEAIFFSLFSVTDKGSSIIGPLVAGIIVDKTQNMRYTFFFIFVLVAAPLGVFYAVDVERGMNAAQQIELAEGDPGRLDT